MEFVKLVGPAGMFFIMFSLALSLKTQAFKEIAKNPLSFYLGLVVQLIGMQQGWALFFGGTSLLIMVGVAIDTIQQINAYLLNNHYDGLMKSGSMRSKPTI